MLRKIILSLFAFCTLPVWADEPFIVREVPPVYPGGVEQLREDLARQTALQLVGQAERNVHQRRKARLPEGVELSYASVYVDPPTLRSELAGWLLPEDVPDGRVVIGFTVSERRAVVDARVFSTPSVELGEAVCAASARGAPWLPGKRLTDVGWQAAPFPFNVMLRVSTISMALESALREREERERAREERKRRK